MASFIPDTIATIGNFPLTNTFVHTLIVDALLIGSAVYIGKNTKLIPQGFQNVVEAVVEPFYDLADSMAHGRTAKIFPYFMSLFLFIAVANLTSLLPGFGSLEFIPAHKETVEQTHEAATTTDTTAPSKEESHEKKETSHTTSEEITMPTQQETSEAAHESTTAEHEGVHLLRGATSDINLTLALALISVVATHMLSIKITGLKDYLSRFFSLNPVFLFVGLLELIGEGTKIMSLSFRLFGNIYAGETALTTISNMFAFLFPLPFLFLELIVGIVQALVFSILTLVFMSILTTPHHVAEEGAHH